MAAYRHVVELLPEGEGHPAPDDHLVHLVQHVLNQLDLVLNLRQQKCIEIQLEPT